MRKTIFLNKRFKVNFTILSFFLFLISIINSLYAYPSYDPASFLTQKNMMVGGNAKLVKKDNEAVYIESFGENYFSLPFEVKENGFYNLTIVKEGGGVWDILIDGERYEGLTCVSLEFQGEYIIPIPLYLDKGCHSIIFYSSENVPRTHIWRSLSIYKLAFTPNKHIDTQKNWVTLKNNFRMLEIGKMFSGSYINVNIARDMALFTKNGYQYISYYNPEGFLVIGRRELNSTFFEKYWIPISPGKAQIVHSSSREFSLSDPHNFISMQIDADGYIHLAFGHHNTNLKYLRSKYPYTIYQWEAPERGMVGTDNEKDVTYVSFMRMKSGNLLAMFRTGAAGSGYYNLLKYDIVTKSWSTLYSPFITDYGGSSPYFWRPIVSPDGAIHLGWTWRLSIFNDDMEDSPLNKKGFSGFSNKNISYAKSYDEGMTWLNSGDIKYDLPIDRISKSNHQAECIETIPMGESFFNHFGSDFDSRDNPHFTYTRWDNSYEKIPQQWHLYWNGTHWRKSIATHYSSRFKWTRPQRSGRASTYLTRPTIVIAKDDTAIIVSRSNECNNIIELFVSDKANYNSWKRLIAYNGSVGGWEPQVDLDLWHSFNKLDLLLLSVTDKAIAEYYSHKSYPETSRFKSFKKGVKNLLQSFKLNKHKSKQHSGKISYSGESYNVKILPIDARLDENTGYILEIDYNELRRACK
jgi:hypothetical protein